MIQLSMQSNLREAMARIDALSDALQDKATLRAINRTVDAVATEANREVRKVYRIRARDVAKTISKKRATRRQAVMSGQVVFKGRGLNLVDFGARWTRRMTGVSVQVLVSGPRKTIPGTFIARNSHTGFRGVFRRVGDKRYPIVNLRSVSVPQAVRNKIVDEAIRRTANATFVKTLHQQVAYLTRART